jgi:hypothetical protein
MFTQTWKKYLPVITILIKRSVVAEQTLDMNVIDFTKASGGRKTKLSFSNLELNNGKINTVIKQTPLATDLAVTLQENTTTKKLLENQNLVFSMNNNCQLTIVNNTPATEEEVEEPIEKIEES